MSFAELGLHPIILNSLKSCGYDAPTPVQAQAIPVALTAGQKVLIYVSAAYWSMPVRVGTYSVEITRQ